MMPFIIVYLQNSYNSLTWNIGFASMRSSPPCRIGFLIHTMIMRYLNHVMSGVVLILIRVYQALVSPLFPGSCRYRPTCSEYSYRAIMKHGFIGGSILTLRRLLRCHPWGGSGFDPVPSDPDCTAVRIKGETGCEDG